VRKFLRIFLIIVVVLVGLGFLGTWWFKRTMSAAPEVPVVRVEPVTKGNLIETISAPGEVEPKTKVSISAKVSARIIQRRFQVQFPHHAMCGLPRAIVHVVKGLEDTIFQALLTQF